MTVEEERLAEIHGRLDMIEGLLRLELRARQVELRGRIRADPGDCEAIERLAEINAALSAEDLPG